MTTSLPCLNLLLALYAYGKSPSLLTWHKRPFTVSLAHLWCSISYHSCLTSLVLIILFCLFIACSFLPSFIFICASFPCPSFSFLPLPPPHSSHPAQPEAEAQTCKFPGLLWLEVPFLPSGCAFLRRSTTPLTTVMYTFVLAVFKLFPLDFPFLFN